jgi:hypothetical protein
MTADAPSVVVKPAANHTRKGPPSRLTLHRRSLSRSASYQYTHARDYDPILRNLTPTKTLRAFSDSGFLPIDDTLNVSLQSSTSAQRRLGAKAAQTCLDVRSWTRELEEWEWPGTFEVPELAEKTSGVVLGRSTGVPVQTYWGSLPATTVQEYEQRADEIVRQLDEIDVEELKDFVLSAHNEAGSGSASLEDSIGAIGAATDLRKLDDFTAIITATILQALPFLSHLNRLLDVWTIRLAILHQAPSFLGALAKAHVELDRAWATIGISPSKNAENKEHDNFNRGSMIEMQSIIENRVSSLGRTLDRFLDDLEGRSETVPDSWIEKMETLEQQYANWTVQAERKTLENDLQKNRWSRDATPVIAPATVGTQSSPVENEQRIAHRESGTTRALLDAPIPSSSGSTYSTPPADTHSPAGRTISRALSSDPATTSTLELARDDSQTIPSGQADHTVDISPVHSNAPSSKSSRAKRHVPIILPYDGGDGQEYPTEGITGDLVSRAGTPTTDQQPAPAVPPIETPATSFAKKRAMFAGDLERTQALQRATKSPVRSFEHASNAFARLFKSEALSTERSRSSLGSEVGRHRSVGGKTETGIIWGGRTPLSPKRSPRRTTTGSSLPEAQKRHEKVLNGVPVAADVDAPPVPILPPQSPRRSLQGPMQHRAQQSVTSQTLPKQDETTEPFPGFDFGENWPLTPPEPASGHDSLAEFQTTRLQAQTQNDDEGPGLSSPKKPLESDFFHRMFIDSLPGTPDDEKTISPDLQDSLSDDSPSDYSDPSRGQSPYPQTGVPTMNLAMLDDASTSVQRAHFDAQEALITTPPNPRKPSHIDMPTAESLTIPRSSAEGPFTPNSIASETYSPEIQDARVSYFQMASPPLSRTTSAATTSPVNHRPLSSHMRVGNQSNEDGLLRENDVFDDDLMRRASRTSLEVKSIDLTRRRSSSSAIDLDVLSQGDVPSSPTGRKDISVFPPTIHEERPRSPVSPLPHSPGRHELRHRISDLSVVSDETSPAPAQGALNSFMTKRRPDRPNETPLHTRFKKKPEADSFDRHVSEVLQRLPSGIRFRSGATTPQPRTAEARTFSGPRPKPNPRVSSRAGGNLTLAPAEPSPNRRTPTATEPEVKLYHLTQAGREEPIKLFVRLVGEGERVMVRVGGGWADLADYLRQYAEHHGSRTVSGEVDVKAVATPPSVGGNGIIHPALRRRASGPLSAEASRAMANSPSPLMPALDHLEGHEKENLDRLTLTRTTTPSRPSLPLNSPSRPTTGDSNRPGSKHSWSEIRMAGPGGSGKKISDLPEQKARWVEGIVERVQKASADKNDGQKLKQFAELGKVGGTRRVIFNRSASRNETRSEE